MSKIMFISDSTCDLTSKIIKDNNIQILPLYVNFGEKSFKDGIEINQEKLYQMVAEIGETPKTSAATPAEFFDIFEKHLKEGYEIIYTGIGAGFSRTMDSAIIAKDELESDKIHLVDSANLSAGSGLLILKGLEYQRQGLSAKEIADKMRQDASKIKTQFAIETLEFLHKGGRCSGTAKLFGSLLKLRPIIAVRDGAMSAIAKKRGAMINAADYLINMITEDKDNVDQNAIIIVHSYADELVAYTEAKIKELFPKAKIYINEAGCVITAHCGKGTMGLLYSLK